MSNGRLTIERYPVKRQTLAEFANEYGLTLRVYERPPGTSLPRFYASFPNVERKDNSILRSEFGDGTTEEEAIAAYATRLSGQLLVIDAYRPSRKDIVAPILTVEASSNE